MREASVLTRRRVFLAAALVVGVGCYEVSPSSRTEAPPPAADEPQTKARSESESETESESEAAPRVVSPKLRYQSPASEIVSIVDAPPTPSVSLAADGETLLLAERPAHPGVEVIAEPWLGLAGERIIPRTNERRRTSFYDQLRLVAVASGDSRPITGLPEQPRLGWPDWSPDGRKLAFTHTAADHVELWLAEVEGAKARKLIDAPLNATLGDGLGWLSGSERLLVRLIPRDRGSAPVAPKLPQGPRVEESAGRAATNRTYQDLLESELDDALFAHYFTSELAIVGLDGELTRLGRGPSSRGVFASVDPSPDGNWLLVERLVEPFSRAVPWYRFATSVELWPIDDASLAEGGAAPIVLAELPVAEEIPIEGVRTGPRRFEWQPLEPATLVWAEALDEGDPEREVEHRDKLMRLAGPFAGKTAADARELIRVEHRYAGVDWLQQPGRYLISEYDRDRRWRTTHLREVAESGVGEGAGAREETVDRVLFDRSIHDSYADPGWPVYVNLADDTWVVRVVEEGGAAGQGAAIFLDGEGASPEGDRPFLDRLPLAEGAEAMRLFQAPNDAWATFIGFVGGTDTIVTRREGPGDPPDWFREPLGSGEPVALTSLPHPHPQLDGLGKRLLTYRRRDGVPLSATLYTPPGYEPEADGRLPLMIWAYPREYVDSDTAGQVRAAPTRFTRVGGTSPTVLLAEDYAVLYAAMPVVGDPETMNDSLIPQLVMSAEAAIDAVVELGVADRERVAIGGHSYGAFMVANLLAHSDLFEAGVARSGAYNRSLTPFGFQSERRTLWEATDAYVRVSPLFAAAQIDEPILLIHGELDDNSGTYPLQTRRLFHALQGLGGTARMVILPHEAHGYRARESILHTLYETSRWLEAHVKSSAAAP